ncbi:DUF3870 domain-containing protein [Rubeoparvulum massiliense]|uniref:DUF3870 domain-containing protein n=1 Tax=Rubeoparvulum massiliense TaxID=1631346 RepID=UPI00065E26A5|nr:DUF3870 domain-containing protein [Rubeoparvulum massiliense]
MSIEIKDSYVLVAGFAQLPKGTPVFELQKTIGCILIVDTENDVVIHSTFTFLQPLTNHFIGALLQGKSLQKIDEIITEIENRFIVPPQKAVIQAMIAANKSYQEKIFDQKENACK